jgi:hypothetical protein
MRALAHLATKFHNDLDIGFDANEAIGDLELLGRTYSRGASPVKARLKFVLMRSLFTFKMDL